MGTKLALALAIICLSHIKISYIAQSGIKLALWFCYIDVILCVWEDDLQSLHTFISGLNSLLPRLHFSAEISQSSVTFLHLNIYEGAIGTTHTPLTPTYITNPPTILPLSHLQSHCHWGRPKDSTVLL